MKTITHNGKTLSYWRWVKEPEAKAIGIGRNTLYRRVNDLGWTPIKALTTPTTRFIPKDITFNGQTHSISEWAKKLGVSYQLLYARQSVLGWPPEKILNEPTGPYTRDVKPKIKTYF